MHPFVSTVFGVLVAWARRKRINSMYAVCDRATVRRAVSCDGVKWAAIWGSREFWLLWRPFIAAGDTKPLRWPLIYLYLFKIIKCCIHVCVAFLASALNIHRCSLLETIKSPRNTLRKAVINLHGFGFWFLSLRNERLTSPKTNRVNSFSAFCVLVGVCGSKERNCD